MKSKFITVGTVMTAITYIGCAQDKIIPMVEVPAEIMSYISTHFPNQSISQATKEDEIFSVSYEIILNNLTDLEFNGKREITDIDGKLKLPDSVIPIIILAYVNKNYPDNFIKGWKQEDKIQKIELDNGIDLKFSSNGDFLRIDN